MSLQEEIHWRFSLKFAMVSWGKRLHTICVNRWCNLVPRLLFPSMGKTGLARYSRGDGEAFVQDLRHLYNALDGTEDDAVFDENIPEQKKSEDEEMDDEFETDSEEEDEQKDRCRSHNNTNKSSYYTNNNFSSFCK